MLRGELFSGIFSPPLDFGELLSLSVEKAEKFPLVDVDLVLVPFQPDGLYDEIEREAVTKGEIEISKRDELGGSCAGSGRVTKYPDTPVATRFQVAISERPPYPLASLERGFSQDFRMLGFFFQVIQFLLIRPGPAYLEQLREECSSASCVPRDRLSPPNFRQASGQFLVGFSHRHLVRQDRQCQSLNRDAQVRSGSVSSNHYPAGQCLCRFPPHSLLKPTG